MPRNAEVIRQWKILRSIESSRFGETIDGLAEMTGVVTRTIRRDLEALQNAGFPLYDEDVDGKKRWKLNHRPFSRLAEAGFTVSEVSALYFSREMLQTLAGTVFGEDLRTAFAKVEGTLQPATRHFLDRLPKVLAAKPEPRRPRGQGTEQRKVQQLLEASLKHRLVDMTYHSYASDRVKDYCVEPYRVVYVGGTLYLRAWVAKYRELRTFVVGRIQRLTVLEETFEPSHDDGDDRFGHSLGVFDGAPQAVDLEFDRQVARYVAEREWHPTQSIEHLADGRVRLSLKVCDDWALRTWVLGFGGHVRVIGPKTLATAIYDEIARARGQYVPRFDFDEAAAPASGAAHPSLPFTPRAASRAT
jgi:predicted DNA-binding transcriptional regulator YafY